MVCLPEKGAFVPEYNKLLMCSLLTDCRWNQAADHHDDVLEHWRAKFMTLLKTDKVWHEIQTLMPKSLTVSAQTMLVPQEPQV